MKRFLTPALAAAVLFSACDAGQALRVEVTDRVISSDYVGNGVEWDPYDEAEAWGAEVSDADWAKLSERLDFMRPGYVRCMINSPYRYYDAATGRYDRMRNLASLRRLLQYCQDNGITVAYGEYNPPTWAMKDSQQWVEMSVDYLNFLVCDLGFDCIRHFIIFNEPDGNWASTDGDYDLWRSMAQRFDAEMARYPDLKRKVSLAAPDVVMSYKNPASEYDTAGWVARSAQDLGAQIGIYDVHAYPGQHEVRSGAYAEKLRRIRAEVPAGKKLILGEAGYKYSAPEDSLLKAEYDRRVAGHPFTKGSDCNMLCYDYFRSARGCAWRQPARMRHTASLRSTSRRSRAPLRLSCPETLPEAFFTVIRRATGRATQTDFPRRANAALRGSVSARRFPPKVSFC